MNTKNQRVFYNSDGDFAIVTSDYNMRVRIDGYEPVDIPEEQVEVVKESLKQKHAGLRFNPQSKKIEKRKKKTIEKERNSL